MIKNMTKVTYIVNYFVYRNSNFNLFNSMHVILKNPYSDAIDELSMSRSPSSVCPIIIKANNTSG